MFKSAAEVLARATIGSVFIESGIGKFHDIPKVVSFFESLHIPLAWAQAPMVAGMEVIGGALIVVGLFTRFTSMILIALMAVALVTARREEIVSFSALTDMVEFLYIIILLFLTAHGARFLSIDRLRGAA